MPSNRPAIPTEITREILIEFGHRCAVCGVGCPLERAHIIPWHKSKEHKAEDLICLCANCHERADKEKWGAKTLREYKQRPWVMRQYEKANDIPEPMAKVCIEIDMEVSHFDGLFQRLLQSGLAGFLEISPDAVRITSIEEGSVKITIELPTQSAERLLGAYRRSDPELFQFLDQLVLLNIHQEVSKREQIQLAITFDAWVRQIYTTQDEELDCDGFFEEIPEYVDMEIAGVNQHPRSLEIEHHLRQCPQCYEFYLALRDVALLESRQATSESATSELVKGLKRKTGESSRLAEQFLDMLS